MITVKHEQYHKDKNKQVNAMEISFCKEIKTKLRNTKPKTKYLIAKCKYNSLLKNYRRSTLDSWEICGRMSND